MSFKRDAFATPQSALLLDDFAMPLSPKMIFRQAAIRQPTSFAARQRARKEPFPYRRFADFICLRSAAGIFYALMALPPLPIFPQNNDIPSL